MEQTVKDVLPALTTNSEGLKKVLEDLVKQYKTKQDELDSWKVCHLSTRELSLAANTTNRKRTTSRWSSPEVHVVSDYPTCNRKARVQTVFPNPLGSLH